MLSLDSIVMEARTPTVSQVSPPLIPSLTLGV